MSTIARNRMITISPTTSIQVITNRRVCGWAGETTLNAAAVRGIVNIISRLLTVRIRLRAGGISARVKSSTCPATTSRDKNAMGITSHAGAIGWVESMAALLAITPEPSRTPRPPGARRAWSGGP
jgi:hypothetical protein